MQCPCHGNKDGFRLFEDANETGAGICEKTGTKSDIFALLQWINGWTFPETKQAIMNYLGMNTDPIPPRKNPPHTPTTKKQSPPKGNLQKDFLTVWNSSESNSPRLKRYFHYRGLSVPIPDTLRLHSSQKYIGMEVIEGKKTYKSLGNFHCMIAQIIRDGKIVGLHRTYLSKTGPGKADVPYQRKAYKCADTLIGGTIQLYEALPDKILILAEGIETALACHEITGHPVWSSISSSFMKGVELPSLEKVKSIFIAVDKDRSNAGLEAALATAKTLQAIGHKVKTSIPLMELKPGQKSIDWLDYLNDWKIKNG